MLTVYKYSIELKDYVEVELPKDAQILCFKPYYAADNTIGVHLWAVVDTEQEKEIRHFRIAGTGHPLDNAELFRYIQTIDLHPGEFIGLVKELVFHIFEVMPSISRTDNLAYEDPGPCDYDDLEVKLPPPVREYKIKGSILPEEK